MFEIGVDDLHKLLLEGRMAAQYAWEHYDELAARKATYTLYGPYAHYIGAGVPSNLTPKKARKLAKNTRRKDYLIYELDETYKVLRTISVCDYAKTECVYHQFELNGTSYAYPFRGSEKVMYTDSVVACRFLHGKPTYFGIVDKPLLLAQFYEYDSSNEMTVSTYQYWPIAKHTKHGYPVEHNAPIGALNSSVQIHCHKEVCEFVDFAEWFRAMSN